MTRPARRPALAALAASVVLALPARAQAPAPAQAPVPPPSNLRTVPMPGLTAAAPAGGAILLTIFLRHDQSRPLPELNAQLEKNGWYDRFPPAGTEVVSWYVMMGIGQVVTLRVPPDKLRDVNLAIENGGWGAYRTEFYPTYDYRPVHEQQKAQRRR